MRRRDFLKTLGLGAASVLAPPAASAEAQTPAEELTTLLDLSRCIGCGACVEACREANAAKFPEPIQPIPKMYPARSKPEDFSSRRDEQERLTPYNWLYIQTAQVEWQGQSQEVHIPRRCLHCHMPPCAKLCPWGAATRAQDGTVSIAPDICLGGAKCRTVCPWSIPQRQSGVGLYLKLAPSLGGNGVMFKCDRCPERRAQGLLPACIEACPNQVQRIGPRREMEAAARKLAAEMPGYIYGLEENGGTGTLYVSPVPFETLNAAVDKGPGKPHLAAAPQVLHQETALVAGTLLAPLAGVVAGALRLAKQLPQRRPPAPPPDTTPSTRASDSTTDSGRPS